MKNLLFGLVAMWSFWAVYPVYAVPVCTNTVTAISGSPIAGSVLTTAGNCVLAGDEIFGNFAVSGAITAAGSATFTFASPTTDVTLGFQGTSVTSNTTGSINYEVEIDKALAGNLLIDNLQKDFSFNAAMPGMAASAVLTGTTSPTPALLVGGDTISGSFACTRSLSASGAASGTCPQTGFFSPLISDLLVGETITAGTNTNVTALTDTISQAGGVGAPVSEPATVGIFAIALLVTSWLWERRRRG